MVLLLGKFIRFRNTSDYMCASLAHHSVLGPLRHLRLEPRNLPSLPTQHLAALTSCVPIIIVSGCDLVAFMYSVKSKRLEIFYGLNLGRAETRAL